MDRTAGLADLNRAAEALWETCQAAWPGFSVDVLAQTGSTNAEALSRGREGAQGPLLVTAWEQTAGRGRAGRLWEARPGQSLAMSLALPMVLGGIPGGGSALSLAAGLWVAQALEACLPSGAPSIQLKWPNDLWVNDRKLGGILIEAIQGPALPPDSRWVVIGVGVNLGATDPDWRGSRIGLADLGAYLSPGQSLQALVPSLLAGLQSFQSQGFGPLQALYARRDVLHGRPVALWTHQAPSLPPGALQETPDVVGVARGVDTDGALLVDEGPQGEGPRHRWSTGDVSVRPRPGSP